VGQGDGHQHGAVDARAKLLTAALRRSLRL
jgi:hypothetical protein